MSSSRTKARDVPTDVRFVEDMRRITNKKLIVDENVFVFMMGMLELERLNKTQTKTKCRLILGRWWAN